MGVKRVKPTIAVTREFMAPSRTLTLTSNA